MKNDNLKVVHNTISDLPTETSAEEKQLYDVLEKLPQPRKHFNLSDDQKKLWYWFGAQFLKTKQLTELDLIHLQKAAFWLNQRNNNIRQINRLNGKDPFGVAGTVQTFVNGANNVTGYISIVEKADKHLDEVSAHFGLSFRDRKKLAIENNDPGQLDIFANFITQNNISQ
jgi:phage terminase small subunit